MTLELLGYDVHLIESPLKQEDARLIADALLLAEMDSKTVKLLTGDLTDEDRRLVCKNLGHEDF